MMTTNRYEGKVALITGGGAGLGHATALRLAAEGAAVGVADIRPDRAAHVAGEITRAGGRGAAITCDVTIPADNERAVAEMVRAFGGLHVLVTSAGIGLGGTVVDTSEEELNAVIDLDLRAVILSSKYAIPEMRRSGAGAIVHISSIAGVRGDRDSIFCAAKTGVVGLTQGMAAAHAREHIRVNCVCPGVILTPMTERWLSDPQVLARASSYHPMGRIGRPEEVAAAIAFLASDEASFITGAILPVDGGYVATGRWGFD